MNRDHKRFFAAALAALQTVAPSVFATELTDVPMAVKNVVTPNVMFTLDDSGSMQFETIPESSQVYLTFPRPSTLYGSSYYSYGTFDQIPTFDINNKYARCYRNSQCNKLYYDPRKLYKPWANSSGSLMTAATPSAACYNPYNCGEGTRDLTSNWTATRNWVANDGSNSSYSLTFYPATYFEYTGTGTAPTAVGAANNTSGNYTKVEIKTGNTYTHTNAANRTDCTISGTTATCSYSQEIQNFANWFSFYRSRILTARGGAGLAFSKQGTNLRVGFATINKGSSTIDGVSTSNVVKGVRSFSGTDRDNWFSTFYGYSMPTSGTPLRRALDNVGQYFKRTDDAGPWGQNPGSSGGSQWACRQNYNILMTDGYWNGNAASTTGATQDVDSTNSSTKTRTDGTTYQFIAKNPFNDGHSNTLADVAMYYWINDLRSDMANKIVPPNVKDPAFWQHLVNFTVGLGVYGTIPKTTIDAAFAAINTGSLTPAPTSNATVTSPVIAWPTPCDGCTTENVDDLAHAALNSRGNFFSAADPEEFANALTDALNDIVARTGAAAAVAVANANVTAGDNTSYASSYDSGSWTGTLDAYAVDVSTGIPSTTSLWTPTVTPATQSGAQYLLDSRTPAATDRFIVTYKDSGTIASPPTGIQFQPSSATTGGAISSKMSAAQTARFNTPPSGTDAVALINYLRGERSGETAGTYRTRAHLLGDIINAEPVVIRPPSLRYFDAGYTTWKTATAQVNRTKMVAQGANDGMVHIFNGTTGAENWAFIPNRLIQMADPSNSGTSMLNLLSRKDYVHKMFVDATPVTGDVDFSNTDGVTGSPAPDWRTILVGGLGKGGRGVYALDMSTPEATSEADAASKVLWEFPNNLTSSSIVNKVGYVFGRPIVVKTKAKGWVVLVAAGYNNGTISGSDTTTGTCTTATDCDGHGILFILNARTGDLLASLDTGVGTATDPAGLAHITAFVEDAEYNAEVQQVYGGDLKGNVWRFDLSDSDTANWKIKRVAILKDGSGVTQPVTTEPQVAAIKINGAYKRFVYVGTGRYLGDGDVTDSQTQTMYGLVDNLAATVVGSVDLTPVISDPTRTQLQVQTFTTSGTERTIVSNAVDYTTKSGWYIDLPDTSTAPSERANTNPVLVSGALVFTSNIPSSDPCIPGGASWLNVLDYKTGGFLANSTTSWSSYSLGNTLASRAVVIKTQTGLKSLVRTSDGQTITTGLGIPPGTTVGRRAAWREIIK